MKRKVRVQRLAKREEKAVIKKTVYFSIVSLVILALFFTIGISLLGRFADFLGVFFDGAEETTDTSGEVAAPILEDLPSATNSASLFVSGFSSDGEKVEIYLNDSKEGEAPVESNQFVYEDLRLKRGENKIAAKAVAGKTSSGFSSVSFVAFDDTPPQLEVETPSEGQTFSGDNRILVSGKTDSDSQVFVNAFLASIDFEGNFEVSVPVSEGESVLEIRAVDSAGNSQKVSRKINFQK